METAKVDIRKLQLLNDRINQTIDALNQVRLSVHGLSLSSGSPFGVSQVGFPGQQGAYGASPYAQQLGSHPLQGGLQNLLSGLSHTSGYGPQQVGQLGHLGQVGQLGHLGQLGQLAQLGINPLQALQGLSHTAGYGPQQLGQLGIHPLQAALQSVQQGAGYGAQQFGQPGLFSQLGMNPLQAGLQGFSHTAGYGPQQLGQLGIHPLQAGMQGVPQAYGVASQLLQNPWLAQSAIPNALSAALLPQAGLGHTSGSEWLESSLGSRQALSALFPFAHLNYSPFTSPV